MALGNIITNLTNASSKTWTLTAEDPTLSGLTFQGQFVPENFTEGGGNLNLGESNTINKEAPNFQYLNNQGQNVSFRARVFAQDRFKNVKQQIELIKSFKRRDAFLKRPPIFLFTYGTEIDFTCFVRDVVLEYDEIRDDGSIRGAIIQISLQKLTNSLAEAAITSLAEQVGIASGIVSAASSIFSRVKNFINIPGFSIHTIDRTIKAKSGDTFEEIARREYGNPLKGDLLRKAQPEKRRLKAGDDVILLDPTEVSQIRVTPRSIALRDSFANLELRQKVLERRGKTKTIIV